MGSGGRAEGGKMLSDFRANSSGSGRTAAAAAVAPEFGAVLFSSLVQTAAGEFGDTV